MRKYDTHEIITVDMRPIKSKNTRMCKVCGATGNSLKTTYCWRYTEEQELKNLKQTRAQLLKLIPSKPIERELEQMKPPSQTQTSLLQFTKKSDVKNGK